MPADLKMFMCMVDVSEFMTCICVCKCRKALSENMRDFKNIFNSFVLKS